MVQELEAKLKKVAADTGAAWGGRQLSPLEAEDRLAVACEKAPTDDAVLAALREVFQVRRHAPPLVPGVCPPLACITLPHWAGATASYAYRACTPVGAAAPRHPGSQSRSQDRVGQATALRRLMMPHARHVPEVLDSWLSW